MSAGYYEQKEIDQAAALRGELLQCPICGATSPSLRHREGCRCRERNPDLFMDSALATIAQLRRVLHYTTPIDFQI